MTFEAIRYCAGYGYTGWRILRVLRELRLMESWSPAALERLQSARLHRLLQTARHHVAPWRDMPCSEPEKSTGCSSRAMLTGWPVLEKSALRDHPDLYLNSALPTRSVRWHSTGGSTGQPLRLAKTSAQRIMEQAAILRGMAWWGIRPGARYATVKGYGRASLLGRLRMAVLGICWLNSQRCAAPEALNQLARFKPRYLTGYPSELCWLADAAGERGPQVPAIFSTGEMLWPHQRARLQAVFGATVSDYYGCTEVGAIAFQCEAGSKHVADELVIVETLDAQGQPVWDEPGRIVLTDLHSFAMPLIRYAVGDVGVLSRAPCRCGRGLLQLKALEGRQQESLRAPNGQKRSALYFSDRFKGFCAVRQYQLEQPDWCTVIVRYVCAPGSHPETELELIRSEVRDLLGEQAIVHFTAVESIPRTPYGKTRIVIGLPERAGVDSR